MGERVGEDAWRQAPRLVSPRGREWQQVQAEGMDASRARRLEARGRWVPPSCPEKGLARPASTHAPPTVPTASFPQPQPCPAHARGRGGNVALRCSPCTGYFREAHQTGPSPHRSCTL